MYIDWSDDKNTQLLNNRGVSFVDILIAINENKILAILNHPNTKQYSHQKILVIDHNDYVHLVPFVIDEEKLFLKTIIPSRKATKEYLKTRK